MQKSSVARVFAWFCCVAAAVAFGPNPGGNGHPPGGVGGYSNITTKETTTWNTALENYKNTDDPVPSVDYQMLLGLGPPSRFRTQIVAGTKYYFEWPSTDIVEVWEQTCFLGAGLAKLMSKLESNVKKQNRHRDFELEVGVHPGILREMQATNWNISDIKMYYTAVMAVGLQKSLTRQADACYINNLPLFSSSRDFRNTYSQ
eukprot:gene16758-28266_t